MSGLISIDDALAHVLRCVEALPAEAVPLSDARGRVLVEPARALVDLPPFPSSAMDGFAVRARDTPGTLPIAFRIAAGNVAPGPVPRGAAAAIATGGAVPEGADAVVPVEHAQEVDGRVEILERAEVGAHVRERGGDVEEGATVVERGTRLGPAQIGALAASGVADVVCARRPRVAVLATGSELRPPGAPLEAGQIYESNRALVAAALVPAGADVDVLPVVGDDETAHRDAIERGLSADVLVTTGGVSVGPHDLVRRVEAALGVREVFWGVAVKPGKPVSFGVRGSTLVFGLPGNPVSSLVGALLFVRPALFALQGAGEPGPVYHVGRLSRPLRRNEHRDEFVRARRQFGTEWVTLDPVPGQESHMIVRAAAADALVHVPRGGGELSADEPVRYLPLE